MDCSPRRNRRHVSLARVGTLALASLGVLLGACLAGCASASKKPTTGATNYMSLYQTGQYAAAHESAAAAASSLRGTDKQQASLIAGLSAQALNRNVEAERWLKPLVKEQDKNIAGKAGAALGLIAQERKEHEKAVDLLTTAAAKLTGDDAARATMYAGDSLKALGKADESHSAFSQALSQVQSDSTLRSMIVDRLNGRPPSYAATPRSPMQPVHVTPSTQHPLATPQSGGAYTVQIGAFSTMAKAQTVAAKYGSARVVPITKDGQTLFAVRAGRFPSQSDAEASRRQIGTQARVVLVTGE